MGGMINVCSELKKGLLHFNVQQPLAHASWSKARGGDPLASLL